MARPTKWRKIEQIPSITYFAPKGTTPLETPENILKLEEVEALRLKDLEGLEQEECAARMEVSRPTFQRILLSAREKVADSLINGKAIRIDGGNYTRNICPMVCLDCGNEWTESYENIAANNRARCGHCKSDHIECGGKGRGRFCGGNCHKYGRNME